MRQNRNALCALRNLWNMRTKPPCGERMVCQGSAFLVNATIEPHTNANKQFFEHRGRQLHASSLKLDAYNYGLNEQDIVCSDFQEIVPNRGASPEAKNICCMSVVPFLQNLSPLHIASLFDCCKQGGYINRQFFSVLANRLMAVHNEIGETSIEAVISLIGSLSALYKWTSHKPTFFGRFEQIASLLAMECMKRGLGDQLDRESTAFVIFGISHHGRNHGKEVVSFVGGLLDGIRQIEACDLWDLEWILHGCARLGCKEPNELGMVCDAMSNKISKIGSADLAPHLVSNTIWAIAELDIDHPQLLGSMTNALVSKIKSFDGQQLVSIFSGLSKLGHDSSHAFEALCKEVVSDKAMVRHSTEHMVNVVSCIRRSGSNQEHVLDALFSDGSNVSRYMKLDVDSLCSTFFRLNRLGYNKNSIQDIMRKELGKPHRLREMVSLLEDKGHFNQHVLLALKHGLEGPLPTPSNEVKAFESTAAETVTSHVPSVLLTRMTNAWKSFSKDQVVGILASLSRLAPRMPYLVSSTSLEIFLQYVAEDLTTPDRLLGGSKSDLSSLCLSLARLQYYDPKLMDHLIHSFLACKEERYDSYLFTMAHSCAVLNHYDTRLEGLIEQWMNEQLGASCSVQAMCTALRALAVWGKLSCEKFEKICNRLASLHKSVKKHEGPFKPQTFSQVTQAWLSLDNKKFDREIINFVDIARSKSRWNGEDSIVSDLQFTVHQTLKYLGIEHTSNAHLLDGNIIVDILLSGEERIVVEVDGPSHYTMNTVGAKQLPLGHTVLRNKILENHGYKVVCILEEEWRRADSRQREELLLASLPTAR